MSCGYRQLHNYQDFTFCKKLKGSEQIIAPIIAGVMFRNPFRQPNNDVREIRNINAIVGGNDGFQYNTFKTPFQNLKK